MKNKRVLLTALFLTLLLVFIPACEDEIIVPNDNSSSSSSSDTASSSSTAVSSSSSVAASSSSEAASSSSVAASSSSEAASSSSEAASSSSEAASSSSEAASSSTGASSSTATPEILKMYTETTYPNSSDFAALIGWPVWSEGGTFSILANTTYFAEGSESMACNLVTTSGDYWGMGIQSSEAILYEDLSRFAGASLKCQMMAPVGFSQNVTVGIQTGTAYPNTHDYMVNPFDYGLADDGNWHDVVIPFTALGIPAAGTQSLETVHLAWTVGYAGTPTANATIYFDDVRWEAAP